MAQHATAEQFNQLSGYEKLALVDPTHTTTLRKAFVSDLNTRFRTIRGAVRKAVIDQDCFGLRDQETPLLAYAASDHYLPGRRAFAFPRAEQKTAAFMEWFDGLQRKELLEVSTFTQVGTSIDTAWTNKYVTDSYSRGVQRARYELRKIGAELPTIEKSGGIGTVIQAPIHADRIGVLYTRVFEELKGISAAMSTQVSRVLSQGMIDGKNPMDLAKVLIRTISGPVGGLGITDTLGRFIPAERRAQTLARTEIIRAHHLGNIQEMRNWGVEGVRVKAEWVTGGNPCPDCEMMAARSEPYTLDEIEGLIPYHPNCKCCAIPLRVEEHAAAGRPSILDAEVESEFVLPISHSDDRKIFGRYDVWNKEDVRSLAQEIGLPDELDSLSLWGNRTGENSFLVGMGGKGGNIKKLSVSFSTQGERIIESSIDQFFLQKTRTGQGRKIYLQYEKAMEARGSAEMFVRGGKNTVVGEAVLPRLGFTKEAGVWKKKLNPMKPQEFDTGKAVDWTSPTIGAARTDKLFNVLKQEQQYRVALGHEGGSILADNWLREIAKLQKMDGLPNTVSPDVFDQVEGVVIHRGVKDAAQKIQFSSGEYFGGTGVYGNGYYFTTSQREALGYAFEKKVNVIQAKLPSSTKVISWDTLKEEMLEWETAIKRQVGFRKVSELVDEGIISDREADIWLSFKRMGSDPGRYSALKGYDAIHYSNVGAGGQDYYVVINRAALLVKE